MAKLYREGVLNRPGPPNMPWGILDGPTDLRGGKGAPRGPAATGPLRGPTMIPSGMNSGMPTLARNLEVPVLADFLLSGKTGFAPAVTTKPIPGYGNVVAGALLVVNASAASNVTVTLQGSLNRMVWKTIVQFSQAGSGYADTQASNQIWPWIRAHLEEAIGEEARLFLSIVFGVQ